MKAEWHKIHTPSTLTEDLCKNRGIVIRKDNKTNMFIILCQSDNNSKLQSNLVDCSKFKKLTDHHKKQAKKLIPANNTEIGPLKL